MNSPINAWLNCFNVSVQTISRWECGINCPDIILLPTIARLFHVTTDFLLGVKGYPKMAKLLKTKEVLQCNTREQAEELVNPKFPVNCSHR